MRKKDVEIRCTIMYGGGLRTFSIGSDMEKYINNPVPKLHVDLLREVIPIEGVEEVEVNICNVPPFEDTFEIFFSSWTKMIKGLKQIDQIFHIFTDGKYLIDLENNCITIQW